MRKIFVFVALLSIVFACSDDDPVQEQTGKMPEGLKLESQTARVGDVLTISGEGFIVDETYVVTFTKDVVGKITEITTSHIKVEVPKDAVTGDIALTYKGETKVIGTITIASKLPEGIKLESQAASPGDVLTINGGFIVGETYVITFTKDVPGKVTEVTTTYLKVEIPANAVTGDITLTYKGESRVVGTITIAPKQNLYAYKRDWSNEPNYLTQIVKIDKESGAEEPVANIEVNSSYYDELVFDDANKTILGLDWNSILKVNVQTGQSSRLDLQDEEGIAYEGLVLGEDGTIYAYKRNYSNPENEVTQIVKIDKQSGQEQLVATIDIGEAYYYTYLVFDKATKNIIGVLGNSLLKVNIETGKSSTVSLQGGASKDYNELVLDDDGNLYAYKRDWSNEVDYITQIVKIDKQSGSETLVANVATGEGHYYENLVFDNVKKCILGIVDHTILKVDVQTGKSTTINLQSGASLDYRGLVFGK